MDIETLKTLKDVLIHASITEAARRSYLAQQTVSKRIASLEKELGCELLLRTSPIEPTPAGRAVMRYADVIINAHEQMVRHVHEIAAKPAGVVTLRRYATNTFGGIAARITEAVARERQNLVLEWLTTDEDDVELLRRKVIDVGFRHSIEKDGQPETFDENDLAYLPLPSVEFPLTFAVRQRHPLSQVEQPSLADIIQYRIEVPSFASRGAVVASLREHLKRTGLTASLTTTYCTTSIGYYAQVSDESVALSSGSAASGLSPEGMGLGFVLIHPADASYRVQSFAVYRRDNTNPHLPYVLKKLREADERGLGDTSR